MKNYTEMFEDTGVFENIFTHMLNETIKYGFVDNKAVFIYGTHIKAMQKNVSKQRKRFRLK